MVRLLILACFLALAPVLSASAQPAAQPSTAPQLTPAEARQVLDVLTDPDKRARFIATLDAIAKSLPPAAPAPSTVSPIPLAPDSLGAEVLVGVSGFLNHLSSQALAALRAVRSVPLLWAWLNVMATDPWARGVLLATAWRLVLALVLGLAAEIAIRRAVRRPGLTLAARAPRNGTAPPERESGEARAEHGESEPPTRRDAALIFLRRLPLVLGRLVLELLPVLGFLLVGHLIAASALGGENLSRVILLAVIDAYALCAAMLCLARMLFSPARPRLRLLPMSGAQAAYAMRWTRRIVVASVSGYAIAEVGLLLGLSDSAHDALLKAVVLLDHVFLAVIVLQQRRTVRRWLRAPPGAEGAIAALRNRFARAWHWIALVFLAALWLVWATEVPHGYRLMLRYLAASILVLLAARLAHILVHGLLDRMLRVRPETASRYPGLEARLALYHPVLRSTARALIFLAGVILLLQLWGLGAIDWLLGTAPGEEVVSALVTIGATLLLALAVWETANVAIERHLAKLAREAQAVRSARLRTLLPLLRSTLLITILVVAGLMVLSQIGVNIGPLLAGAGIVGVAIGFGAQKLVQDLITGVFLLLENAMQVGDWVTLAGLSGTVENLSIRTIRLRAADGSVHIVPFSAVTSLTNVNRGIGNASVSVTVAFGEDTDRVSQVLKDIVDELRQDPDYAGKMLSDLQLWGVDKLDGASVTIVGQVVCTDSGRWSVQRELNRRMKQRFEELGIELFNPMRTIALLPPQPPTGGERGTLG